MHNKAWIADNRLALVGGRNIGDEYFNASDDVNFVDLDYTMVGPVVRDVSDSFDRYWNSSTTYPIEVLDPEGVNAAALEKLRVRLAERLREANDGRYVEALRTDDAVRRLVAGDWKMEWTDKYRFVADDPGKINLAEKDETRAQVALALVPLLRDMKREVVLISPYFVPGEQGTRGLAEAARSGKLVRVLTNSLAANDVAAVHGGYSRYRKELLEGGVQIWELKPIDGITHSAFGSSGASLHTKALSIDGRIVFVGSYNIDPRSTWLNCEQGVVVESPALAAQIDAIFKRQTTGERSWRVTAKEGDLAWSDGNQTFGNEPEASAWRRVQSWFIRVLGLDSQL
jgi:putative cardiolipin synthase